MNVRLSDIGPSWQEMVDAIADFQSDILRRRAAKMADALDRQAMRDVEGAREWRGSNMEGRYRT